MSSPANPDFICHGLLAGLAGAIPSGAPSTMDALGRGEDPLTATRAAGSILVGPDAPSGWKYAAAVPVHLGISVTWGVVLARWLPRRAPTMWGALAGLAIAAVDLGLLGRRFPEVSRLRRGPQVLDHVAYGAVVGFVVGRLRADSSR